MEVFTLRLSPTDAHFQARNDIEPAGRDPETSRIGSVTLEMPGCRRMKSHHSIIALVHLNQVLSLSGGAMWSVSVIISIHCNVIGTDSHLDRKGPKKIRDGGLSEPMVSRSAFYLMQPGWPNIG